ADLNGDGKPDIVVASGVFGTSGTLSVLLGNGDGTFQAGQVITVPTAASATLGFTIDDVNGDHKLHLVAVTRSPGTTFFLGKGDGTSPPPAIVGPAGAGGALVAAANFNGDSNKDLVTSSGQILLGNGDGTFQLQPQTVGFGQIGGVATADFDKNGKV